ncbi:MAG: OmpA family protein [Rubricoccaceae bacterium]
MRAPLPLGWLVRPRWWALPALVAALVAAPVPEAQAQQADTVVVPVPVEGGVLYYRAGAPGGVRIRSRRAPARPAARLAPPSAAASWPGAAPLARVPGGAEAITPEDLAAFEERLLRALDARLAELVQSLPTQTAAPGVAAGAAPPPTVVVVPGQETSDLVVQGPPRPAVPPPAPAAPPAPPVVVTPGPPLQPAPRAPVRPVGPPAPPPAPAAPDTVVPDTVVTVEEVERRILETGLFRTTRVLFATARADLLDASRATLDAVGEVIARYPSLRIAVDGHTDSVGSDATNDPLSLRRAESVRAYLLERFPEIAPERLVARGFGSRQPVASNATDLGRTLNRRVEFVVLGTGE